MWSPKLVNCKSPRANQARFCLGIFLVTERQIWQKLTVPERLAEAEESKKEGSKHRNELFKGYWVIDENKKFWNATAQ